MWQFAQTICKVLSLVFSPGSSSEPGLSCWHSAIAPLRAALRAWVSQFSYYAENRWSKAPTNEKVQLGLEAILALAPRLAVIAAGYWVERLALFGLAWLIGAIVLL